MTKRHTIVVLAAGMGSRYGGLKQMDAMTNENETIIDFSLYDAIEAGFRKVVFIVRDSFIEEFKALFEPKIKGKIEIEYVCQELDKIPSGYPIHPERSKPWGTAHALMVTKEAVDENFIVVNGDDFYSKDAFVTIHKALDELDPNSTDICMVGYSLNKTVSDHGYVSRGECFVNDKNELENIIERTHIEYVDGIIKRKNDEGEYIDMNQEATVSMNFWGFTPKFYESLENDIHEFLKEQSSELKSEYFIPTVVNNVLQSKKGKVKVLKSDAKWFGVTYPEDKPIVVEAIAEMQKEKLYPIGLW